MKKVEFSFDKLVSYWNKDLGAGVKVDGETDMTSWMLDISWLDKEVAISNISEIQEVLMEILESNDLPTDYFTIMDDGRISFNTLEDGRGQILDEEQADYLHERGEQVYLCDYNVFIEIKAVYTPDCNELKEMFPQAEY